jgi:predicted short-subunit dehydrogenase-like oxidoreductase (DUF2520 family)
MRPVSPLRELDRPHTSPAPETALPPICLIGRGRVGGALQAAAERAGLRCRLAGRDDALSAAREAEIALLCVPDAEIPGACEALAEATPPLRFVGHVSGAGTLGALAAASAAGASAFSIPPLQTVPDAGASLQGAPAAVAGSDAGAIEIATRLASRLGLSPFAVPEQARAAYHAAASIASNFLVTLTESAAELLAAAGIEDGRELLAPLVLRSAANWAERGGSALTGPIARGDETTVARHRFALAEFDPDLIPLYEAMAERTRELAERTRDAAAAGEREREPAR